MCLVWISSENHYAEHQHECKPNKFFVRHIGVKVVGVRMKKNDNLIQSVIARSIWNLTLWIKVLRLLLTALLFIAIGNKKALLQGEFPPTLMQLIFTENNKGISTYFSADGKGGNILMLTIIINLSKTKLTFYSLKKRPAQNHLAQNRPTSHLAEKTEPSNWRAQLEL